MAKSDYADKTKTELDEIARAMNIEGRSTMDRDELVKAIDKNKKAGADGDFVTPREDQGAERAVTYLEDGEERELSGSGSEVAGGTADQGSLGGTITGPDVDTSTGTVTSPTTP